MEKHFFFKLERVDSKLKIYPIKGQTDESGNSIDSSIVIKCTESFRKTNPVGSVFVSSKISLSKTGKYYCVSGFKLIDKRNKSIVDEYNSLVPDSEKIISLTLLDELKSDKTLVCPTSSKDGFFMNENDWNLLVRNIRRKVNTLIIGPTGTGKTSCVKEVCSRLGIKLHIFDMGSMIDPISSLLGVHRLEDGHSVFDFAKFTQVIQEPCVILLDELNRASISSNNVLFPCLDDRRELSVEIAGSKDKRSIKVHPDVTFIATANIGSEYTGTIGMDKALVNRFFPLELGYIPGEEEEKVLIKRMNISDDSAKLIVKVANNIRSLFSKSEISTSVSIRETLMVAGLISDGWDLGTAMGKVYLPLFEGSLTEGEKYKINQLLMSY